MELSTSILRCSHVAYVSGMRGSETGAGNVFLKKSDPNVRFNQFSDQLNNNPGSSSQENQVFFRVTVTALTALLTALSDVWYNF